MYTYTYTHTHTHTLYIYVLNLQAAAVSAFEALLAEHYLEAGAQHHFEFFLNPWYWYLSNLIGLCGVVLQLVY